MTVVRVERRPLEDIDESRWARLLEAPDATPFHSLGWARALTALPHTSVQALIADDAGTYVAGLLCAVTDRGPRRTVSSLPFGTYGGPIAAPGADRAACADRLVAELLRDVTALTTLDLADWGGLPRDALSGAEAIVSTTHVLALDEPYPRLSSTRFAPTVRQKIRQAERDGVRVIRAADAEHVAAFLHLARGAYARHDSIAPPAALYEAAIREMIPRGEAMLSLARLADGAIAGAALHLRAGGHAFNWLTAIDPSHARHRPANALVDDAIRWAYETRSALYNFGATPRGATGVESFKKAWGAAPRAYTTYRLDGAAVRWARHVKGLFPGGGV